MSTPTPVVSVKPRVGERLRYYVSFIKDHTAKMDEPEDNLPELLSEAALLIEQLQSKLETAEGLEQLAYDQRDKAWEQLKSAQSESGVITERRWRDTKVTRPCDGDNVLGYWAASQPGASTACDVVHYYAGRWHDPEDDDDDYRAPDFWMPLPETPL